MNASQGKSLLSDFWVNFLGHRSLNFVIWPLFTQKILDPKSCSGCFVPESVNCSLRSVLFSILSQCNLDKLFRYMIMEYCVGELQEMLNSIEEHKFPTWQAHG